MPLTLHIMSRERRRTDASLMAVPTMSQTCYYTPDINQEFDFVPNRDCRWIEYSLAKSAHDNFPEVELKTFLNAQIHFMGTYDPNADVQPLSGSGLLMQPREFMKRYFFLYGSGGDAQKLALRMYREARVVDALAKAPMVFVPEIDEEGLKAFGDCEKWHPWVEDTP